MNVNRNGLLPELTAEFVGTFILILIGDGAVAVSVWTGAYDLWAVALMWALAVALAVYAVGAVSGAHINPAVTITMAAFGDFEWRKVLPYIVAQILGAFVAAAAIHVAFSGIIEAFEAAEGIVRGQAGSQLSAMVYTTYAPNPAIIGTSAEALAQVSHVQWFVSEVIITAVLLFGIFFLVEAANEGRPLANMSALLIGLLVGALVAYEAPVSMAALNPARDLGPRIWTLLAGWGEIAFPGPRAGFWIPTVSTIVGGLIGGAIYTYLFKGIYPVPAEPGRVPPEVEAQ
ncbi:MAG TPA: MIP/aquaporin family protein [Candidatus Sulfomarinibacteraceae bacterium]|nr:MIP/aquaporin family protein [Candidatus Sulfomarinibacteraceae bacterium]